jgi:Eukaryotic aspartyl protease
MACANNAPPLMLPWTNVTVSKDGNAVARGIELGVGTPNQVFSLRPSVGDVNTWLFNMATCGSASNDSCIGFEGGAYDPQASSTYQLTTQARWNGSQSTNEQGSFIYFNDDINFGQNGTAYGYPMFLDQPGQGKLPINISLSKH